MYCGWYVCLLVREESSLVRQRGSDGLEGGTNGHPNVQGNSDRRWDYGRHDHAHEFDAKPRELR